MKKSAFFIVIILIALPLILVGNPNKSEAATAWSRSWNDLNSTWWISNGGFGNVSYDLSLREEYNYTYRYELVYHEQWAVYNNIYSYKVDVQHSNKYSQSSNHLNSIGYLEWGNFKYGIIYPTGYTATGGGNSKLIVGNPGSTSIKVSINSGAHVSNTSGSIYGSSNTSTGYIPN